MLQTLGNLKVDSTDSSVFYFIEDGFSPVRLWWKKNAERTAGLLLPLFLTIQLELWLNEYIFCVRSKMLPAEIRQFMCITERQKIMGGPMVVPPLQVDMMIFLVSLGFVD